MPKKDKGQSDGKGGESKASDAAARSKPESPEEEAKLKEYRKLRRELQMVLLLAIAGVLAFNASYKAVFPHPLGQSMGTTDGVILRSAIMRNRRFQFPPSVTSKAQLTYQYKVDGKTFENTDPGVDSTDEKAAGAVVDKYPEGAKVQVLFDPLDPQSAYLKDEAKAPPMQIALFAIGVISVLVAVVLLFRISKSMRKNKR